MWPEIGFRILEEKVDEDEKPSVTPIPPAMIEESATTVVRSNNNDNSSNLPSQSEMQQGIPNDWFLFFDDEDQERRGKILDNGLMLRAKDKRPVYAFGTLALTEEFTEFSVEFTLQTSVVEAVKVGIASGDVNLKYLLCGNGRGGAFFNGVCDDESALFLRPIVSRDVVSVRFSKESGSVAFALNNSWSQTKIQVQTGDSFWYPFVLILGAGSEVRVVKIE